MSDQQLQKLNQQAQINQQLQQRLGGQNLDQLGSLQARYAAPLSGSPYPNIGTPLPTPSPFNFGVQPQAQQQMNPFQMFAQAQAARNQQPQMWQPGYQGPGLR